MSEFVKVKLKSLKANENILSKAAHQIAVLEQNPDVFTPFKTQLQTIGLSPLQPTSLEIFQINLGKMCNQVCTHCHVDAGPDRKEIMTKETMEVILKVLKVNTNFKIVDMTGGAPEMNPQFRWLVEQATSLGRKVIDRCNLTILSAGGFTYLPEFLADHRVTIIASLPCYLEENCDAQRGTGVFVKSIAAIWTLNQLGYGLAESNLDLHLEYNPVGTSLPPAQSKLEQEYREQLLARYGIHFSRLFTITNMPISRYLDDLLRHGKYMEYMQKLTNSFNPSTIEGLMCRSMVSVDWNGNLYDCDFNQMLDLGVEASSPQHISQATELGLIGRRIQTANHCFGCTSGCGSSCTGSLA